jgi:hypothetical protein
VGTRQSPVQREAWAGIPHTQFDVSAFDPFRLDGDHSADVACLLDRLGRISYKIEQDLLDLEEVDHDGRQIVFQNGSTA